MYQTALIFALTGAAAALLMLRWGAGADRRLDHREARRPFESGLEPQVHAWHRFHARWLNYALLFLPFALLPAFLFPWAAVLRTVGWSALAAMLAFAGLLILGIVYAWRERAFRWD